MGNEQSFGSQPVPENGLRLSTLCRYQADEGAYRTRTQKNSEPEKTVILYASRKLEMFVSLR